MLTLAHPWLLLLLPVPLLVRWLAPPHREDRVGLNVPFLDRLARLTGQKPAEGAVVQCHGTFRNVTLVVAWALLVIALARPQVIKPAITKTAPVRDILLAVDLSGSMETKDFTNAGGQTVDRLTAVKEVLDDFLAHRKGDRAGLILFGSAPFVQAPFTEDLEVCRALLAEAQVRMTGPKTALGDALGLAIAVFDRGDAEIEERVLIALTDGNDTASQVPPAKAAEIARDKGIVIHTVAVGDPKSVGEEALDEETLKAVAKVTGGLYSFAADRAQLGAVYDRLDALEAHKAKTVSYRPRGDLYVWPLGAAFVISLAAHLFVAFAGRTKSEGASPRSAGSQPAVSPTSRRPGVGQMRGVGTPEARRTGNPRHRRRPVSVRSPSPWCSFVQSTHA